MDLLISVIKKPILTEKTHGRISDKKYTFEVAKAATKVEIKIAFEKLFGAKVAKVNILKRLGKKKTAGKYQGRTSDAKYAIITLKPGETLEIFEEPTNDTSKEEKSDIKTLEPVDAKVIAKKENEKPTEEDNVEVMNKEEK